MKLKKIPDKDWCFSHFSIVLCAVIKDCQHYNIMVMGYNGTLNYIPISSFTHAVDQWEFNYFVFGVLGPNDAVIPLSNSMYPDPLQTSFLLAT